MPPGQARKRISSCPRWPPRWLARAFVFLEASACQSRGKPAMTRGIDGGHEAAVLRSLAGTRWVLSCGSEWLRHPQATLPEDDVESKHPWPIG